jgi:hypothetical protein
MLAENVQMQILYCSYHAWLLVKYKIFPTNVLYFNIFILQYLYIVCIYLFICKCCKYCNVNTLECSALVGQISYLLGCI